MRKRFGGFRICGVVARAMLALVEYVGVQMLLTQLLVKTTFNLLYCVIACGGIKAVRT